MRSVIALFILGMTACSPALDIRPQSSVQFKLSRLAAEGKVPCAVQIFADGELVVNLKAEGDVRCPLPHFKPVVEVGPVELLPVEDAQ